MFRAHTPIIRCIRCCIWFSALTLWMGGGLQSRCVDRVYGADGAVRLSHMAPSSPKSNIRLHSTIQYISTKHLPSLHDYQSMRLSFPYTDSHNKTAEAHILVFLAIVSKNEIFQLNFNLDPFFICQCWPDVMGLSDGRLIRLQYHLGTLCVDMEGSQNQDQTWESLNYKESNIQTSWIRHDGMLLSGYGFMSFKLINIFQL